MLKNLKIGTKIVLIVFFVVLFAISILTVSISYQSYSTLNNEAYKLVSNAGARNVNKLENFFNQVSSSLELANKNINSIVEKNSINLRNQALDIVQNLSSTSSFISYAYIVLEDYSVIAQNNKNFTMSSALKQDILNSVSSKDIGKMNISSPIVLNINNQNIYTINFSFPIYDKNKNYQGVVGILYNIDALAEDLLHPRRSIFENDKKFLMTQDGLILFHSDKKFVGKNIKEIGNFDITPILNASINTKRGVFDYQDNDYEYLAGVQPFKIWNTKTYFTMATLAPKKSIYKPFYTLLFSIITLSMVSLIFIGLIILYFVKIAITSKINQILMHLISFFKYLNHEIAKAPSNLT
ncbi:cache domain-containing protein, partial [Campylobacter volucris]|uniref:cache domain-containing protein n=1 Tax=Campylobacter volucris TaxID=1031542 RepID=UPI0018A0835E